MDETHLMRAQNTRAKELEDLFPDTEINGTDVNRLWEGRTTTLPNSFLENNPELAAFLQKTWDMFPVTFAWVTRVYEVGHTPSEVGEVNVVARYLVRFMLGIELDLQVPGTRFCDTLEMKDVVDELKSYCSKVERDARAMMRG